MCAETASQGTESLTNRWVICMRPVGHCNKSEDRLFKEDPLSAKKNYAVSITKI